MVNRVWHHLFGRGIVASVDNFGVLGESADASRVARLPGRPLRQEGWSVKKLIRALVLSSDLPHGVAAGRRRRTRLDPSNLLLHRMRLRRLEGEAIRDAMLAVSGRLEPEDVRAVGADPPDGRSSEGRGRPASGPLDGDGRRSLYLAVRRNFLSPLLLAFDTPIPFSTVGRRTCRTCRRRR